MSLSKFSYSRAVCLIFLVGILFFLAYNTLLAGEVKTFSKEITTDKDEFVIEVAGTLDPENIEITIENLGSIPIVDPRISVNDKYDWFDVNSIAAEATRGCVTDQEKALGVWEWILFKRYQLSPRDRSALSPVRGMNGYGYGNCGFCAAWLKALCTAVGVKARVQEIWGHTVNEVFYDGQWHYLDSNCKVYYLAENNRTFTSLAELESRLLKTLCSTPFGIRGSFTCRLKFFTFTTIRAQRLSASEVVLLLCSRI